MIYSEISDRKVRPHVKVWEDFMGVEVPFDDNGIRCQIHHVDKNYKNNDIHNLVCVTRAEHTRWHSTHRSIKTRNKMSTARKGTKISEEQKLKISNTLKGVKKPPRSEEYRKNIKEAWAKRRLNKQSGT